MSNHTPAPWLVYESVFEHSGGGEAVSIIIGHDRNPDDVIQEVAYVHCDSSFFDEQRVPIKSALVRDAFAHPEAKANAEHIVHCVNNHQALVDALRDATLRLEGFIGSDYECDNTHEQNGTTCCLCEYHKTLEGEK